jgi:hypothetical protein
MRMVEEFYLIAIMVMAYFPLSLPRAAGEDPRESPTRSSIPRKAEVGTAKETASV